MVCVIRCRHKAGQRLYTRPSSLIQAPNGHLIGSPKIGICSTNMEEDKTILARPIPADKRPLRNIPKWWGESHGLSKSGGQIRNPNIEIRNKSKIRNANDTNCMTLATRFRFLAAKQGKGSRNLERTKERKENTRPSERDSVNHGLFRVFVFSGFRD